MKRIIILLLTTILLTDASAQIHLNGASLPNNNNNNVVKKSQNTPLASPCVLQPNNPTFVEGSTVTVYGTWTIMGTNPTYQWYFNDSPIQGETDRVITARKEGKYNLYTTINFNGKVRKDIATTIVTSTPAILPQQVAALCGDLNSTMVNNHFSGSPCGIAISLSGKVAISDFINDGVLSPIKIWNTKAGFEANQAPDAILGNIWAAEALTFTPDEKLVITETSGAEQGVIYFKQINGVWTRQLINGASCINLGNFNNPRGIAAIDNNTILLANDYANEVVKIDLTTGNNLGVIQNATDVKAVAVGDGKIAIAIFGGEVRIYDLDLNPMQTIPVVGNPVDIAIANHTIYVNTSGKIQAINLNPIALSSTTYIPANGFTSLGYNAPFGMAFDGCSIYIGNNHTVIKFK